MSKRVLLIRSNPYDMDPKSYNIQEIGMGKAFCDLGYDFDFITFKKRDQKEWIFYKNNGCRAKWIEKPRVRLFRWGLNNSIAKREFLNEYDIVICREYYQYESVIVSRNHDNVYIYNGPYWNMFMIPFISPIYDLLFRNTINNNIKAIFTKSSLSEEYLRIKGYENIHNVGVALDTTRFESDVNIDPSTKEIVDYMNCNRCILYVGQVNDNKNYPFLLRVYERLLNSNPDLKFVVIGKSRQSALKKIIGKSDESFESECYKKTPNYVKEGIFRVNRVDNNQLKFIYPLAKAFLLPSKKEIFGMVLLEAMYLGAPVVTSWHGGSSSLIHNKESGKICFSFDVDEWSKAVQSFLDDEMYTLKTIKTAHKIVAEEFNWNIIAKKMLRIIE